MPAIRISLAVASEISLKLTAITARSLSLSVPLTVALAVVPMEGHEADVRALRLYCAKNLADFQQPHKIFVVDKLPKNAMGKLQRMKILECVRSLGLDR